MSAAPIISDITKQLYNLQTQVDNKQIEAAGESVRMLIDYIKARKKEYPKLAEIESKLQKHGTDSKHVHKIIKSLKEMRL